MMSSGIDACAPGASRKPPTSGCNVEQLPRRGKRNGKGPCLVDLLKEIERPVFDRMAADSIEFHAVQEVERIA
jgi:hypothetical protein